MASHNTFDFGGRHRPTFTFGEQLSNQEQPSQQLQPNGQEFRPVLGPLATNGQTPIIRPTAFGRGRATQQLVSGPNTGGQQLPFRQLQTQQPSNETEEGNDSTNSERRSERNMGEIMALLANLDKKIEEKVGKLETLIESKHLDGCHGHRNDVLAMKEDMEKKMDLKFNHLVNCFDILVQEMHKQHQGIVQEGLNLDVKGSFSKVEGLVGGLEKKIDYVCQEGRKNYQDLTNAIRNNGEAIGDVCKITDRLLQNDCQQHAVVMQKLVKLGEEKQGGKMEELLHDLLEEGRQQNKDLQETVQDLNVDIGTKITNLTQTLQWDGREHQRDMLNAISESTEDIKKMLSDMSGRLCPDRNGDLNQTIKEIDRGFQREMSNLEDLIRSKINELDWDFDGKLSEMLATLQQGGEAQHSDVTWALKELDRKVEDLEELVENLHTG